MDWGGVIAGAFGGGAQAVGQLADNAIEDEKKTKWAKMQADLQLEGQKRAAEFKQQLEEQFAQKQRDRITDTMATARTQANDEANAAFGPAPTEEEINRAGINQLAATGDLDAAAKLDKLSESGGYSLSVGGQRFNSRNVLVADNNTYEKLRIDKEKADAALLHANGAGQPRALDQAKIDRLNADMSKYVDNEVKIANPFANPNATDAERRDTVRANALKSALQQGIMGNALDGKPPVNVAQEMATLQPLARRADLQVIKQANDEAKTLFDDKGKPKSPNGPWQDANQFRREFREENYPSVFRSLLRQENERRKALAAAADAVPEPAAPDSPDGSFYGNESQRPPYTPPAPPAPPAPDPGIVGGRMGGQARANAQMRELLRTRDYSSGMTPFNPD